MCRYVDMVRRCHSSCRQHTWRDDRITDMDTAQSITGSTAPCLPSSSHHTITVTHVTAASCWALLALSSCHTQTDISHTNTSLPFPSNYTEMETATPRHSEQLRPCPGCSDSALLNNCIFMSLCTLLSWVLVSASIHLFSSSPSICRICNNHHK